LFLRISLRPTLLAAPCKILILTCDLEYVIMTDEQGRLYAGDVSPGRTLFFHARWRVFRQVGLPGAQSKHLLILFGIRGFSALHPGQNLSRTRPAELIGACQRRNVRRIFYSGAYPR
jgi:hypothetical protein